MYRVTEESLMDRLSTITHLACLLIPQDCRYSLLLHLITGIIENLAKSVASCLTVTTYHC